MPFGVWEFDLDSMFRPPSDVLLSATFGGIHPRR